MSELTEHDVAVVVFCRALGVDAGDASDRVRASVLAALRDNAQVVTVGPRGMPVLEVPNDPANETVLVVQVVELSTALGNGYVVVTPGRRIYRDHGLDSLKDLDNDDVG